MARFGTIQYTANNHDPVRDYQIGPAWWHALSVRAAFLPLQFVLVHSRLPEPSPVPRSVQCVEVPVGVYDLPPARVGRDAMRQSWNAKPAQRVFLAFGYVRDGKNLDLAIAALSQVPEAFLVIAGTVAAGKDRPFSFYRQLAVEKGVAGRVHFHEGFVADDQLADYFAGADAVLLSYSGSFRSQSGVLNLAARSRKPVLASAATSPLTDAVSRFRLGCTVAPDSTEALVSGMRELIHAGSAPDWAAYEAYASWDVNAAAIIRQAGLARVP